MSARHQPRPADLRTAPRRFLPLHGQFLTMANIRGPWRPSGAVGGAGIFAIVWDTWAGSFWAALHDFEPADQLRLVDSCRRLERDAGYPGAPSVSRGGQ